MSEETKVRTGITPLATVPHGETLVGMVEHKGMLIVATDRAIYRYDEASAKLEVVRSVKVD